MPLRIHLYDRLVPLDAAAWDRLFPSLADSYESLSAMDIVGMEGFSFASVVVYDDDNPILLVPLFRTDLHLETLTAGPLRTVLDLIGRTPVLCSLLHVRVLGIGFVEGEWSEIGYDRDADSDCLDRARQMAEQAIRKAAAKSRAQLLLLLNFTPSSVAMISRKRADVMAQIDTYPCAYVKLPRSSLDEYIAGLSKNARKDIRKKLRECGDIKIDRPASITPWIEEVYALYTATVERADLALGRQPIEYFRQIMQLEPKAQFVLYWLGTELLGFNLLVRKGDRLVDKYFCMKPEVGRAHHLYFVSWIENVRYCLNRQIEIYHAGPGAELTKARLGARFVRSITLFRHRNPLIHAMLKCLRSAFSYQPAMSKTADIQLQLLGRLEMVS